MDKTIKESLPYRTKGYTACNYLILFSNFKWFPRYLIKIRHFYAYVLICIKIKVTCIQIAIEESGQKSILANVTK